jgi:hypothetical protein
VTKDQLQAAINAALAQKFTATTKTVVHRDSQADVRVDHREEWRKFKREMNNLGWTIHPSIDRLEPGDRVPSFSSRYVQDALERRISFTRNMLDVLGEEPDGCRKYLLINRAVSSSSTSVKHSNSSLQDTFASFHFYVI